MLRVAATIIVSCLLWLTGCDTSESDVLRFGLSSAPVTLDPRFATDAASDRINRLLYERLVDFDDGFNVIPSMAQWTQISPTVYRFVLREDRGEFLDGGQPSARDVAATYRSILDQATASPHRGSLTVIDQINSAKTKNNVGKRQT